MSRRNITIRKRTSLDQRYGDPTVGKVISVLMSDGKKSLAEGLFYGALDIVEKKTNEDPLKVFKKAVENIRPLLEVKPRRVGGATYQVPVDVRPNRRLALALRWLVLFASKRKENTMIERLAGEVVDAYNKSGAAVKKREETHKMAEANRAFSHFRW